ncbi:MAG: hypothetical protein CMA27_03240 [Euryarchaeota archaeon]|nr:hypothetical protein [Euryarchaeota archaeon]|tara:strand:- start:118 stop:669 length:552 start_codon:yes stop_codon:yes gene_type:complete
MNGGFSMVHRSAINGENGIMRIRRSLDSDESAVSPVIATVLLLAITVLLTSIIVIMISGSINTAEKAPPIAEVSVTGLENGFQIVKFTDLNKHLDPDMVQFNIYHSEDLNQTGFKGFAGDADVYGRIGSVIAFHDKDAMYTVNEGDYFIINSTAAGTDDGMWIMRLYYQRSNSELSEIRLPAL